MENVKLVVEKLNNFNVQERENEFFVKAIRGCKRETTLPKKVDNELAYFAGVITGDGCIYKETKKYGRISYNITIDSITPEILVKIKEILKKRFKLEAKIIKVKRAERLAIRSVPVALYLNQIFEIPIGKKSFKTRIPNVVKNNKGLTYSFVGGIIDTDFGKYGRTMGMSVRSKKIVSDFKEFFDTERIRYKTKTYKVMGKPAYHIWLNRQDIPKLIESTEKHSQLQNKQRKIDLLSRGG